MVQHVIKKWRDCWRAGQLDPFATFFNLSFGVDPEVYSSDVAPPDRLTVTSRKG